MPDNIEIIKKMFDACKRKDFEAVKALVHPDYTLKDPVMELHGPDELVAMLKACPGDGGVENVEFIAQGDKVVSVFDGVATKPVPHRLRMCSIVTMKDGKAYAEEMFYDTAQIPPEVKKMMEESLPAKKSAA